MRLFTLAMNILAIAAMQSVEAAESVVQAQAEFMTLSYQLKDLTPGDSIGPVFTNQGISYPNASSVATATYGVQGLTSSGTQIVDRVIDSTIASYSKGNFFTPLALDASLFSGEASATRSASGAKASVSLDDSRFVDGFTYGVLGGAPYGGPVAQAQIGIGSGLWKLGAGTELSFTATIKLGVSVDAAPLIGLTQGETLRVLGAADVIMGFKPASWQSPQNIDFSGGVLQESISVARDVGPDGVGLAGGQSVQQQTFTLTGVVRNLGSADVYLDGSWQVNALARVTPVPEPSTWALLIAGLGLVQFARRRQAA